MRSDTLMSFGCDHMYGWHHQSTENNTKPSDHTYTSLLAKHHNLNHYNFSEGGTSNQGIIRQVILAQDFEEKNNLNSIYWIQWSSYHRLEIPFKFAKNICKNSPYVQVLGEVHNQSHNKLLSKWADSLYKNIDDLALFVLSCNAIIQVNSFLLAKNKKVINTFAHSWDLDCEPSTYYIKEKNSKNIDTMYNYILDKDTKETDKIFNDNRVEARTGTQYNTYDPYTRKLWKNVESYTWHNWGRPHIGFKPWASKLQNGLFSDGHPTEKAHREAFDFILKNKIF
jgi:hypothetical protein